jgi:hypothetical protein
MLPPHPEAPEADEQVERDDQPADSLMRVNHAHRLPAGTHPYDARLKP